jgi:DNA-binding transcriptional LysR family regulator
LVPTDACRAVLPRLEAASALIDDIERALSGADARLAGTVRVTAPELMSPYLVRQLDVFRARYPDVFVEVLSSERKLDLASGEADVAIRVATANDEDLVVTRVTNAGVSVYASEAYIARKGVPTSFDDLAGHDVIAFGGNLVDHPGAVWLARRIGHANVVMTAHSVPAAYSAAVEGVGIAVLPCMIGSDPRLRRITDAVVDRRPLALVVHPEVAKLARVKAFVDFLNETMTRDAGQFGGTA